MAVETAQDALRDRALQWAIDHGNKLQQRYFDLLSIPSVSTDPDYAYAMTDAADWLVADLRRIGLRNVQTLEAQPAPVVYGEWLEAGDDLPTLLLYAHYDVMPADTPEAWVSPPFEPTVRDGRVYARGAVDDKCGTSITIAALESILAATGRLPVNVKVMLEGGEECGSPGIADFVARNRDLLSANLLAISDGGGQPEQPMMMASVRGTVSAEVIVQGPKRDLHSGGFGGVVENPIHVVGRIIASLHDASGRIAIPGFYDKVETLASDDSGIFAAAEARLQKYAIDESGTDALWGTTIAPFGDRATRLPTCDINGVWGGHQGPGGMTVIPSRAGFKVSMRIVPNLVPHEVMAIFRKHVLRFATPTAQIEVIEGTANWHASLLHDGPVAEALQDAYRAVWGTPACIYRAGGCVPLIGVMQQQLGIPIFDLGYGVGENGHAANEYMELAYFHRGIQTAIYFLHGLALRWPNTLSLSPFAHWSEIKI